VNSVSDVERDAGTFLDELYGIGPDDGLLIAISTFGRGGRTAFASDTHEALSRTVGHADVYTRITLLAERPRGRGLEANSAALPGVWAEFDVNGGPLSSGGVVAGAFESIEQAAELAHRVLAPTMLVRSGYGLHAYWLFYELLRLEGDRARAEAKALVQAWQAQLRRIAAEEFGIEKLDSTHDLARVFRPVGSFNSKGNVPELVTFEDHNGTRYTLDELSAHIQEDGYLFDEGGGHGGHRGDRRRRAGTRRSPADLLETFPKLEEIARRRGKAPKDSSRSGWDHYLGCEAARCGATDDEIIAIIRHGRSLHGEEDALTDAYLERTLPAVRAQVPGAGETEDIGIAIGRRYNLGDDDPIVGGQMYGTGEDAIVRLRRRSGAELRLGYLRGLFSARSHTRAASVACQTMFPAFTDKEAAGVAQQIIALCELDADDGRELAAEWTGNFYEGAGSVVRAKMETTDDRRSACARRKSAEAQLDRHGDIASRTAVILDEEGQVWIPTGPFRASLSPGAPSWQELGAAMAEIGWRRQKVELWSNPGREDRGEHIKVVFYVGKP
jgi:hypothetical protein